MSLLSRLPVFPLYYGGRTKFSPIHVSDVAELIFYIITNEIISKKIEAIDLKFLLLKNNSNT